MEPELQILPDVVALAEAAERRVRRSIWEAVQARGRCTLALSGGSTPRALYERLARPPALPWDRIQFFFGDERHVPPDDPESNARMARGALFDRVPVPAGNVHRIRGEWPDAEAAAVDAEQTLRRVFAGTLTFPRFDLILLGLGPDGHTASLFPRTPGIHERARWVIAQWVPKLAAARITLTPPVLNAAAEVLFLVAGRDKAAPLREVLEGSGPVDETPAKVVRPSNGQLIFFVDRAAASLLRPLRVLRSVRA